MDIKKIESKNKIVWKDYFSLPQAFKKRKISDVVDALKNAGYAIFSIEKTIIARKEDEEILFDNNHVICSVSDYDNVEAKLFNVSLIGSFKAQPPKIMWLNI